MRAFICKRCGAKVIQYRAVDGNGWGEWWYACQCCGQHYGRPVYDKDLEFLGSLDVTDPGLEPWTETL
jgi:hypothetical protein